MTLIALYIFFLNHLLSAAHSNNVTSPTPSCLTVAARHIYPEDCISLIASLNFEPEGVLPHAWGVEGNVSTELPLTVAQLPDCELLLQKADAWHSPPPSFALASYDEELLNLYYECVEGGLGRGGKVRIGPGLGIIATLWTARLPGDANGTANGNINGTAKGLVNATVSSAAVA